MNNRDLASAGEVVTLLQITDTHLFADSTQELLGVKTLDSFSAVVDAIVAQQQSYDAILMTGDVSQDHSDESYQRFEQGIEPLVKTCYWLPGNHDYKPGMNSVYPSEQISDATQVLLGQHWQMILLDSQVQGLPHGELSQAQLDFLQQQLELYPQRHCLVLLHHHSRLVGSAWLDKHCLKNADQFWQVVEPYTQVKAVLGGHVHQDFDQMVNQVRVLTSPSTCIQFKPNSDDFALDTQPPGWRYLSLHPDGHIDTQLHRLTSDDFLPNLDSQGY